jgi:hypothetical protein
MRSRALPGLILSSLLVPALASATMVVPLDLDALTDQAHHVVLARVESQRSRFTSDRRAIYTEVTLTVLQSVKGPAREGERIVVRREGGVVDGLGMRVSGAAVFTDGEEVLVFLEPRGEALWTVGMAQGKMHVHAVDGHRMVSKERTQLNYVAPPKPEPAMRPLDEVLQHVSARAAEHRR